MGILDEVGSLVGEFAPVFILGFTASVAAPLAGIAIVAVVQSANRLGSDEPLFAICKAAGAAAVEEAIRIDQKRLRELERVLEFPTTIEQFQFDSKIVERGLVQDRFNFLNASTMRPATRYAGVLTAATLECQTLIDAEIRKQEQGPDKLAIQVLLGSGGEITIVEKEPAPIPPAREVVRSLAPVAVLAVLASLVI